MKEPALKRNSASMYAAYRYTQYTHIYTLTHRNNIASHLLNTHNARTPQSTLKNAHAHHHATDRIQVSSSQTRYSTENGFQVKETQRA